MRSPCSLVGTSEIRASVLSLKNSRVFQSHAHSVEAQCAIGFLRRQRIYAVLRHTLFLQEVEGKSGTRLRVFELEEVRRVGIIMVTNKEQLAACLERVLSGAGHPVPTDWKRGTRNRCAVRHDRFVDGA